MEKISVLGAKVHNLKNIHIDIPRDRLVVITGLSGSGKSSLAFDTIYAEGQRRYVESLSAYARQFLSLMEKPDVEHIEGLSPAISIEQKATSHNPRSTVGTITEIYDYLRLLFARVGTPRCPTHKTSLAAQTVSQMVDGILKLPPGSRIMLLSPIVRNRKGEHKKLLTELAAQGFLRARIDGTVFEIEEIEGLDGKNFHTIEMVVDRLIIKEGIAPRLAESLETALNLADGLVKIAPIDDSENWDEMIFSSRFSCTRCDYSLPELEPRLFSFNNPVGACATCNGLGVEELIDVEKVIPYPSLSLSAGAISAWRQGNGHFYQILACVARHYGFSLDTPFNKLKHAEREIILHGSNDEKIDFSRLGIRGKRPFEGVIPRMQRRYHESEMRTVREELSRYMTVKPCRDCGGERLNLSARNVYVEKYNLPTLTKLSIRQMDDFFAVLKFSGQRARIVEKILKEVRRRLRFLISIGLEYLSLDRRANTLSGGEAQRIRLASQIGAGLIGVLYTLDEPSIGLHQRDNQKLLNTLMYLRDLGNTVIVVEHDKDAIMQADYVVDMGPGAGVHGGEVVAFGKPEKIAANKNSLTGDYLSGRLKIEVPKTRQKAGGWLKISGACGHNLKNIDAKIPVGVVTCITGVSGSGKSTLVNDTLYLLAKKFLNQTHTEPAPHRTASGWEFFDKVININQSPIGRTPRSNPATYSGVFSLIRELFAQTVESRARGYAPGRFSFNVKGGRCEACRGDGLIKIEMHFLPDIYVACDVCKGLRYGRETLEILYKGKTIAEVLGMTVETAHQFFHALPKIRRKLQTLLDVGLSYITLGQNATTLSGGEAQRVKLAKELSKTDTGHTLYILDEPTTGLHFHDIRQLLSVIKRLRDRGNTIVIIEHNLDVIKTADWIIDLGPEGGDKGGEIIATGTPETIVRHKNSHTGAFLKDYLSVPKIAKKHIK